MIRLRYLLLSASILLCSGVSVADNTFDNTLNRLCDSLKNILYTQSLTEKQELDIYQNMLDMYAGSAIDSVHVYAPHALHLAEKLKDRKATINIWCHLGAVSCFRENYDTALIYLDKVRETARQLQFPQGETRSLALTAFVYEHQRKYLTAIDWYLKALSVSEGVKNKDTYTNQQYAGILATLGELNRKLNNTEVAIQYLDKAIETCDRIKSNPGWYAWKIAHVYNEYATIYLERNDLDRALEYALKAENTLHSGGIINKCHTKGLLAKIYLAKEDYTWALQYAGEAMVQADLLRDKTLYVNTWMILSGIYLSMKHYPEAEAEAFNAWRADSANIDESRVIARNIALANLHMGNTEKAAYYFNRYSELNGRYSEKSFHTAVSDLSLKYETEKKELRISSLEWQKVLYIFFLTAAILLAVAVCAAYRQKIRSGQKDKELAVANAILEWEEKERKRFAHNLHDGVNSIILAIKLELARIENTQSIRDKLDMCVETIRNMARGKMSPALERYGLKAALEDYCRLFPDVCFHFFGEDRRIDGKIEQTVYFCAYELVHNSVKHSGATTINVQLIQESGRVSLTVQDSGCGYDTESSGQGTGLKSLRDRVTALNGRMETDSSPGNGTETTIELRI